MYNIYEKLMSTPEMADALINSSVSIEDAQNRANEYAKMFSRTDDLTSMAPVGQMLQKNFAGYAETPLLGTQYFNASVASYLSSFAGYMSVEKDFEQPNGFFYWFDVLGVTDLRPIVPNLGPDNYNSVQTLGQFELPLTVTSGLTDFNPTLGRKIIPGTVRIKVVEKSGSEVKDRYELVDNGQGEFMATAGKLSEGSINYLNGKISFKLAKTPTENGSVVIVGKEDSVGTPSLTQGADNSHANDKRFIAKQQQIALSTVPDMLIAEYSIASLAALKKSTGSDMATFLFTKLRELYTKCINGKLVTIMEEGYNGDTMTDLDLSNGPTGLANKFYDYRSRIDLFDSYLIDVENALATKATKAVTTTAYVVGNHASNQFAKSSIGGKWEKNTKSSYINDLLGWYDGVPVLRTTDIKENPGEATFYAIHKTQDGQMAPLARGIFMPLTDTPTVGNYQNTTQMASGVYYQEGIRYMAPELVQKVTFKVGH